METTGLNWLYILGKFSNCFGVDLDYFLDLPSPSLMTRVDATSISMTFTTYRTVFSYILNIGLTNDMRGS